MYTLPYFLKLPWFRKLPRFHMLSWFRKLPWFAGGGRGKGVSHGRTGRGAGVKPLNRNPETLLHFY